MAVNMESDLTKTVKNAKTTRLVAAFPASASCRDAGRKPVQRCPLCGNRHEFPRPGKDTARPSSTPSTAERRSRFAGMPGPSGPPAAPASYLRGGSAPPVGNDSESDSTDRWNPGKSGPGTDFATLFSGHSSNPPASCFRSHSTVLCLDCKPKSQSIASRSASVITSMECPLSLSALAASFFPVPVSTPHTR